MSGPPDFRELVGDEGAPEELERLRRVHDLLVAAGPPPELSPALAGPPAVGKPAQVRFLPRRRREAALVLAAALVVAAFAIGYAVGNRGGGFSATAVVPMHGLGLESDAHASLRIGKPDQHGNISIEMTVRGLGKLPEGGWYELYLSKDGKPKLSCGTFRAEDHLTTVRLTIAYELEPWGKRFDGWVVTAHVPAWPKASGRVLLTT